MDIPSIRTTPDPAALAGGGFGAGGPAALNPSSQGGASAPITAPGAPAGQTAANGATPTQAPSPDQAHAQADALQKAVAKINQQLEQSSGVTLSAGLDTSGEHPGQVLVELSDKQTKQTFYKYYLPPQNVIQAADTSGLGGATLPGVLVSTKA